MPYAICPGCDDEIYVPGKPRLGQRVGCEDCGYELEVVGLDPLELDWVYEEEDEELDDE